MWYKAQLLQAVMKRVFFRKVLWFLQITSFFKCKISSSFSGIYFVINSLFSSISSRYFFNTIFFSSSLLIMFFAQFKCSSNSFCLSLICISNVSCMTLVSLACSSFFSNCSFSALLLFLNFFNSSNASQSVVEFFSSSSLEFSLCYLISLPFHIFMR